MVFTVVGGDPRKAASIDGVVCLWTGPEPSSGSRHGDEKSCIDPLWDDDHNHFHILRYWVWVGGSADQKKVKSELPIKERQCWVVVSGGQIKRLSWGDKDIHRKMGKGHASWLVRPPVSADLDWTLIKISQQRH
eukprot:scaffold3882_cov164-Amphora_coffeaeformis.AAC.23